MTYCPKCKKDFPEDVKYCPSCGTRLITHVIKGNNSIKWIGYVLLVFGILQSLLGLYLFLLAQSYWSGAHYHYSTAKDYLLKQEFPKELAFIKNIIEDFRGALKITLWLWGFPALYSLINGIMLSVVGVVLLKGDRKQM